MAVYREEDFSIQFWNGGREAEHMHQDVEFLFVIDGRLTVSMLEKRFDMAPSSFSRYFKKRVGITFIEYVNNVRLHFALEDVRYTDKSISRIAGDYGFANSSAFCRAFKEIYQISPMLYRKQETLTEKEIRPAQMDRQFLKKYLKENETAVWHPRKKRNIEVRADAAASDCFENPWGQAINLGTAHMLLSAVLQKQILFAKQEIGFTWGRIFGLFSEKMELRPRHEAGILNFDSLDIIFDFLVENHIRPVICLDNKPASILKSVNEDLVGIGSEKIFDSVEWRAEPVAPDFISIYLLPYARADIDGKLHAKRRLNMDYAMEDIVRCRSLLENTG